MNALPESALELATAGIFAMFVITSSYAEEVLSVRDLPDEVRSPRSGRLANADITLLDVRIGRESLDQVQARFGATESFRHPPNGAASNLELCYKLKSAGKSAWVIFGSGPMGGWRTVTHFQVLSSAPKDVSCAPSAFGNAPVVTRGGVRLGIALKELRAQFGAPTESGADYAVFAFEQKSDHPQRREFDMLSVLSATLTNRRVTSFGVSLIESN
jgi:hypothetical protein